MKNGITTLLGLLMVMIVPAQGVYNLWGMTYSGGTAGSGVIFNTNDRGDNFQKIYDFDEAGMGLYPWGHLTYFNGKLYGMTSNGGTYDKGVIFEIDPATNSYKKKLDFSDDTDGIVGFGSLVLYGTKLYGIGGSNGMSAIFEWDPLTNIYVTHIDSLGISASGYSIIVAGNKFYGLTSSNGIHSSGVLFEWDPATNLYTKKLDFTGLEGAYPSPYGSSLELKDGKLYSTGLSGGNYRFGVIFQWDPVTEIYTKMIDFGGQSGQGAEGSSPISGLTLSVNKFYGMALDGGTQGLGVIYEWDPETNIYNVKHDFDGENTGKNPVSRLCAFGGRLYGTLGNGGINDKGLLFELDPVNNVFIKKLDFDGTNAGYSSEGNKIIPVPAPVSTGTPGSCITLPSVTIDNSNNNEWVPVVDNLGHAVAEIKANGNNLGLVNCLLYVHNGATREDAAHQMYLDRNITITPQVPPATPVDIRFYIRDAELETLKTATNSLGRPSWVYSISDLAIFKNEDVCSAAVLTRSDPLLTTTETWSGGYVLTASVDNFSSFYVANKINSTLPLDLVSFTGKLADNDAVLSWITDNEIRSSQFEIERSSDGGHYKVVGKLSSANTPGVHYYSFTDFNITTISSPVIYYRLKQRDIDGRFIYSPVVMLSLQINPIIVCYPNPVKDRLNIMVTVKTPEQMQLRLIDYMGRLIKKQQWNLPAGSSSLSVDMKGLASGLYYMDLKGKTISKQMSFLNQ